jgi:monothiol glutaredoxin
VTSAPCALDVAAAAGGRRAAAMTPGETTATLVAVSTANAAAPAPDAATSPSSKALTPARPRLDAAHVAPGAMETMASFHPEVVDAVRAAVAASPVVVVGMAQNPHVRKTREALSEAGIEHTYLEYGSYFSEWKKRLAIKLWSGWPTFPMVFVKGTLLGGEDLTKGAIADGTLKRALEGKAP